MEKPQKERKTSKYKHDLQALESAALAAYEAWTCEQDNKTRTDLFLTIKELAFAILEVGKYEKYQANYDEVSYEYALYLFERIVLGSFKLVARDRFPLQHYIRKNILHVLVTLRSDDVWRDMISDFEFLIDPPADCLDALSVEVDYDDLMDRKAYAHKLIKILKIYYDTETIARLLPISLDMIHDSYRYLVSPAVPVDVRDFSIILIASAKRLAVVDNIFDSGKVKSNDLRKCLKSSVRSTVFLSTVVNSDFFPKELLLALDIDSLYRLVGVLGGQTIKIPTQRDLDTLLGSAVAISNIILDGKKPKEAVLQAKEEYGFVFQNTINLSQFLSKNLQALSLLGEDKPTEPLINILVVSMKSLDNILGELAKRSDSAESTEVILRRYSELSASFSQLTDSLLKISSCGKPIPEDFLDDPKPINRKQREAAS